MAKAHALASSTIDEFIALAKSDVNALYMAKLRIKNPDLSERLGEDRFLFLWLSDVYYHEEEKSDYDEYMGINSYEPIEKKHT